MRRRPCPVVPSPLPLPDRQVIDEQAILSMLPDATRAEVALYNTRSLLDAVPYFSSLDDPTKASIAVRLVMEIYVPEDVIVRQSQHSENMYFISRGSLQVGVHWGFAWCAPALNVH